jgi:hypothetical protein
MREYLNQFLDDMSDDDFLRIYKYISWISDRITGRNLDDILKKRKPKSQNPKQLTLFK